jgi:F-type H+-transporting ATPase subunit b
MILLAANAPFWDNPVFWVGVSFAILIAFALKQGVVGALNKALDDRAAGIRSEIAEARRLREEAQALLDDSKRKHAAANDEAAAIVATATQEAEALATETRRQLKESVERRTKVAEEKIARAEAQAIAEVRSTSVELAVAAAEHLIAGKAGASGASLIDQGIRDLKGRLN